MIAAAVDGQIRPDLAATSWPPMLQDVNDIPGLKC